MEENSLDSLLHLLKKKKKEASMQRCGDAK